GLNPRSDHNAVSIADTPTMDRIWADYAHTTLNTSGRAVGLPDGLMGNSEVGHLNLGAGRTVLQAMTQLDDRVLDGSLLKNETLINAIDRVKNTDRNLHFIGLVSDGGVHSWPGHYEGLIKMVAGRNLQANRVFVHAFTDGRDTPPQSGIHRMRELLGMFEAAKVGRVASICGRYYAMDRDKRWERTQLAYDLLTQGKGQPETDPIAAMQNAYDRGETDEFIKPIILADANGKALSTIQDGDTVIFFNFRGDRPRQITRAFVLDDFDGFERTARPKVHFTSLTRYEEGVPVSDIAYPPETLSQGMPSICGSVLSKANKRQLRIAETEKYPHVTFFFNGLEETPFEGEERILVQSPKDVPTYDHKPEMSAPEVADRFIEAIESGNFDAAICNFANADMVGHTGILDAAVQAVTTVDTCLNRVLKAIENINGTAIVTADHGNAEQMIHYNTGEPHTAHTTNPVPFVLVDPTCKSTLREGGALCDVAPTLLGLLNIPKPQEMTGTDLRA
ncbi:MAG: 2,3-bisphosphoglycerate-independent phosphoglycerate mutase, partial [Candidatus Latescibacteria bacterium]|nr:2,3-bisphosphoglycerate-independent phosphoglycerate mutase [Candidatus Latescibacterota bacterium]